jgi:hypothetical protein
VFFHFLFILSPARAKSATLNTNFSIKAQHFQASITIDAFNLLAAAVNGKVVEVIWLDAIHLLKDFGFNSAKSRTIGINSTFAASLIEMNAPAILPH